MSSESLHASTPRRSTGLPGGEMILPLGMLRVFREESALDEQCVGTTRQPFDAFQIRRIAADIATT